MSSFQKNLVQGYGAKSTMPLGSYGALVVNFNEKTRRVMTIFSAVAVSDYLHIVYEASRAKKDLWVAEENQLDKKGEKGSTAA
jgi:hypothetical protein